MADDRCEQCKGFDAETKRLVRLTHSREEVLAICNALALTMVNYQMTIKQMKPNDPKRFPLQGQLDLMGMTAGKFIVSLEPQDQMQLIKIFKDRGGIVLNINHEACPHKAVQRGPETGKKISRIGPRLDLADQAPAQALSAAKPDDSGPGAA